MDADKLSRLAHENGLSCIQRSEHHYQLRDPFTHTALVDVWPSTSRFRPHNAPEGKKASTGSERAAVDCARRMLPPAVPAGGLPISSFQPVADPLQPLIELFRGDEWQAGRDGDQNGLTTAETAARLIRQLRAKVNELTPRQPIPRLARLVNLAGQVGYGMITAAGNYVAVENPGGSVGIFNPDEFAEWTYLSPEFADELPAKGVSQ